ncbi:MAG: glycosyltransferase family 2 protein [Cyanobacteriota bacterium]|nr:glycosyltransferase family 2 protein [Cyanobacteriota bacterium]
MNPSNLPLVSIIIPTHNRPHLLEGAIDSALGQTYPEIETIVVDDASVPPATVRSHSKLQLVRLDTPHGGAAARNIGTQAARGRWITYLDDDDRLLPHAIEVSLKAIETADVPPPVAVISGIEVVNETGRITEKRLPPAYRSQGEHFWLEELEPGRSYNTKQTLVVEREVVREIGGWDETFQSRVHSELFLRLNQTCSILGLPEVTYRLLRASKEPGVSKNPELRQESVRRLIEKYESLFRSHPKMFAHFLYEHALNSYRTGQEKAAIWSAFRAFITHPIYISKYFFSRFQQATFSGRK